eukprot:2129948-Prymnesium_polylepis.1
MSLRADMQDTLVLTVADSKFSRIMQNSLTHYRRMRGAPKIETHCLDSGTLVACTDIAAAPFPAESIASVVCFNASHVWRDTGHGLYEALLVYKLRASLAALEHQLHTGTGGRRVLLIDVDALVLTVPCFNELHAFGDADDIVVQGGGCPGCTAAACRVLGFAINTGLMLFTGSAALSVLRASIAMHDRSPYKYKILPGTAGCYEQE